MARLPQLTAQIARLDEDQRHVVAWSPRDGNVRVIAGAGSGKTLASTVLLARLVADEDVPPEAVVASTFSRKAADEFAARIKTLLPAHTAGLLRVGTFHALALRKMRDAEPQKWPIAHCIDVGARTRAPNIPSPDVLWRTAVEYGVMPGTGAKSAKCDSDYKPYMQMAQLLRAAGHEGPDAIPAHMASQVPDLRTCWTLVNDAKAALGAFDFQDLLVAYLRGLEQDTVGDSAGVVLVDEFQDNDVVQSRVVKMLAERGGGNVCLVGDSRQGIHAWRGAHPELFVDAPATFATHDRPLRYNYRSLPQIVDAGNRIAAGKTWNLGEPAKPTRYADVHAPIQVLPLPAGPTSVARFIQREVEAGAALGDFAVLARTNAEVGELQGALTMAKLPCAVQGGKSLFDHREVETVLCYCILAKRDAYNALGRVVNIPKRYLGSAFVDEVRKHQHLGMLGAIRAATATLPMWSRKHGVELASTLQRLRATPWADVPQAVLRLLAPVAAEKASKAEDQTPDEDKPALYRAAVAIAERFDDPVALFEFGQRCAQNAAVVNEGDDIPGGRVILSTMHRAKGLEWPHVIVLASRGALPHKKAIGMRAQADEERLFYVAVTRAKTALTLAYNAEAGPSPYLSQFFPQELSQAITLQNASSTGSSED